jgi:uncharacterized membrane protein
MLTLLQMVTLYVMRMTPSHLPKTLLITAYSVSIRGPEGESTGTHGRPIANLNGRLAMQETRTLLPGGAGTSLRYL